MCLCEIQSGETSFQFQVFIFGRAFDEPWGELYYFQGNGHLFVVGRTFLQPAIQVHEKYWY